MILDRLNIGRRLLLIGVMSLICLLLVSLFAVAQINSALRDGFNGRTKQTLDVAYSQLERFQKQEQEGRLTREQAQAAAMEAIGAMRFGNDDYFFVFTDELKMLMHPLKPELVGSDLSAKTDADGKLHFRAMRDLAVGADGGGFVEYAFEVPNNGGVKQKTSYARGFKPWNMVIATGVLDEEVRAAVTRAAIWLVVLGAIALVALGALIWVIARSITKPLGMMTARMRTLASGDTQTEIPGVRRKDELGQMAGALQVFRDDAIAKEFAEAAKAKADAEQKLIVSLLTEKLEGMSQGDLTCAISEEVPTAYAGLKTNFNTALENLRDLIAAIAEASQSIETGSTEIAAASDDLARRSESNAASLEQSSAALSQMDNRLRSSADAADHTVGYAQKAMGIVGSGRATADEASSAMNRVSESAQGIDSVIEGLDKIAFQTRVLAMNAAVEAGRAGEAGRGFAVVADLVSALAMRAEEESKRAREQLTATQTDIVVAVDAVRKVDAALADITNSVEQVHQFVETMADDNRAQSATISEIATAVNEMDQSTQQNAAMVEQTSAAARNLASEVTALTAQSARFRIGAAPAASVRAVPARSAPIVASRNSEPKRPEYASLVPALPGGQADHDWASF